MFLANPGLERKPERNYPKGLFSVVLKGRLLMGAVVFCRPVTDKKQETAFRKAAVVWLAELANEFPEAGLSKAPAAVLLSPSGHKVGQNCMDDSPSRSSTPAPARTPAPAHTSTWRQLLMQDMRTQMTNVGSRTADSIFDAVVATRGRSAALGSDSRALPAVPQRCSAHGPAARASCSRPQVAHCPAVDPLRRARSRGGASAADVAALRRASCSELEANC